MEFGKLHMAVCNGRSPNQFVKVGSHVGGGERKATGPLTSPQSFTAPSSTYFEFHTAPQFPKHVFLYSRVHF